jgi:hypothetical protein
MPKIPISPLDNVKLAYPCKTTWDSMAGDDRVRYCDKCQLNVYNLSGMTKQQAEKTVSSTEGRLCVSFYRRTDGTILTQNCPVGLAAVKQRVANTVSLALSVLVTFFTAVGLYSFFPKTEPTTNNAPSSPSKNRSLPVLNQNNTNVIKTNPNEEEVLPVSSSSCYAEIDKVDKAASDQAKKGPEVGGISVNYTEPKVDPFFEPFAGGKFVGMVVRKTDDTACSPKKQIDKD